VRRIEASFQLGGRRPARANPDNSGLAGADLRPVQSEKIEKVLDLLAKLDISLPKESAVISFDGAFHSECQKLNINFPSHYTRRF
jgi:hypothetical protein